MKKVLILLALLPFNVLAQEAQANNQNEKQQVRINFERLSMRNENMTLTKKHAGDLEITGDEIHVSGPVNIDLDSKKQWQDTAHDWIITAHKIYLSETSNPVALKADLFNYNEKTKTGCLMGNIRAIEKGAEKKIGEKANLDFSDDEYKIVNIK